MNVINVEIIQVGADRDGTMSMDCTECWQSWEIANGLTVADLVRQASAHRCHIVIDRAESRENHATMIESDR